MLQLPNLNDQDLESILNNALNSLKKNSKEWTDYDIHDPGITILELLSVLKYGQMKQINKLTVQSLEKFLKLLNIKAEKGKSAKSKVAFYSKEDIFLPKGYKLRTEDIVYETEKEATIINNSILYYGYGKNYTYSLFPYEKVKLNKDITVFDKNNNYFYIGFEKPLPLNIDINMYFSVMEDEKKRNPYTPDFIPLSNVEWEYMGDNEKWENINIINDETQSFLYSGNVVFNIENKHFPIKNEDSVEIFYIRVKCTSYGYEKEPKLNYFLLNSIDVIQQDTKCETIYFTYKDFKENKMMVKSYLAHEDVYELYINVNNKFIKAEDLDIEYMILEKEHNGMRFATSKRSELYNYFKNLYDDNIAFMLILYDKEFYNYRVMGNSNGSINQEFVNIHYKNAQYNSFEIMCGNNVNGYKIWQKTESFQDLKKSDENYIFNPNNIAIRFGDNLKGKVPIMEYNICVISLKLTLMDKGNIRRNLLKPDSLYDVITFQHTDGVGGKKAETQEEIIAKIKKTLKEPSKAVTKQDYIDIVSKTSGLKLGSINVLPLYKPYIENYPENKEKNAVTIVIEPYVYTDNKVTIDKYIKNVKRHIDKYRLITTKLYVIAVEYIPIDIYVEIHSSQKMYDTNENIKNVISQYISKSKITDLGVVLYYSELYSHIEKIENIDFIKYLQIETVSDKVKKTEFGDLKIPYYAKPYLRSCDVVLF